MLRIKIIKYQSFNKHLPQLGKDLSNSRDEEYSWLDASVFSSGSLYFFDLDLLFGLSYF